MTEQIQPNGRSRQRTLSIETGVHCNHRCVFCYQKGFRAIPGFVRMLPQEDVRARMRWGRENGYDEVSFTGGEPTARRDFVDLVAYARGIGYERVALTSNGWMLSRPEYFKAAVRAGLTSVGISLHGPDAATHEAATCHKGSFAHAVQALRLSARTAAAYPGRFDVNSFTVVSRLNADRIVETADVLAALGVRLMVFQPAILSKTNHRETAGIRVPLDTVVQAVGAAARRGAERGFRVKLFNLPPCLFRDAFSGIQMDPYLRATFREHDRASTVALAGATETDMVRLDACADCLLATVCPGLHVTLVPQDVLVGHFEERIRAMNGRPGPAWLAGTDLLEAPGIGRVVTVARSAGLDDVSVLDGGSSVSGRDGIEVARRTGAEGIVLVHHPAEPSSSDRLLAAGGNDAFLGGVIEDLLALDPCSHPAPSLLVTLGDAGEAFLRSDAVARLAPRLRRILLGIPAREIEPRDSIHTIRRLLAEFAEGPLAGVEVAIETPWRALVPGRYCGEPDLSPSPAEGRPRFDLDARIVPTPLLNRGYSVLNWSIPALDERTDEIEPRVRDYGSLVVRIPGAEPVRSRDELERH